MSRYPEIKYVRYLKYCELPAILNAQKRHIEKAQSLLEEEFKNKKIFLLISARVGIYIALKAYNFKKDDEILIPEHISSCVVNIIKKVCTPAYNLSGKTKGIILFHQYGYPQKMDKINQVIKDKNLLIIEDCAHSFTSLYRGKRIGNFSNASIFSFPKVFPTILGGCLVTDDKKICNYAETYLNHNNTFLKSLYHNFILVPTFFNTVVKNKFLQYIMAGLVNRNWRVHHKFPNPNKYVSYLFTKEFNRYDEYAEKRKENLKLIKNHIPQSGYLDRLETDSEVIPFAVPYLCNDPENLRLALRNYNIDAGIKMFDMNRNMFNPDYQKVVALPVHQYISREDIDYMFDCINKLNI